jgi:predicted  nucleic acid-binding Zn-ribbon protein
VKKQIELLVELQQKDRALDRLGWQTREGPERLRGLEKELEALEADLEADKRRIQDLKKTQREYEAEIEDGLARIRKSRGRLMSIKNNKEYRALLREIEETEKANADKEDRVLGFLEELEELNKELEAKEKSLIGMRDHIESEKKDIAKEVARLHGEFSVVEQSREKLLQNIDSQLLTKYEQIKAMSGGIAVALVNNATCSECHLGIPPQMYNELQRRDTLKFCPHCQRIIYCKGAEAGD